MIVVAMRVWIRDFDARDWSEINYTVLNLKRLFLARMISERQEFSIVF